MTLTKEWLLKTIAELEEERDAIPGAVNEDAAMALAAMKLALASLEAEDSFEPVAFINGAWTLVYYRPPKELGLKIGGKLYAAPPAPVVQDIGEISVGRLPTMNQDDCPGLGDWWVQLRIGEDSAEVLARVYGATPQEANGRAEALSCRAAMLQGAAGNSPAIPDGYALVPVDMAPGMMRAVQINSELGAYAAANLSGAYSLFREFWDVAIAAAPQQEVKS